jgi:tetratricopeptide (TPR) repeat protein
MGVSYVLEGSGLKDGDNIRLTVQLIDAMNDRHIWSNSYNRSSDEIFALQSEIAQLVANEIKSVVDPEEKQLIEKIPTHNLTAWEYYLKGREENYNYWLDFDLDHINNMIDYYSRAIEFDPEFSLAYTGLGRAYWMLGHAAPKVSPDYWKESKRLLNIAIELDPQNGWAYAELGVVQHNWDCDSTAALQSLEKALALSPNEEWCYAISKTLEYRLGNCSKLASLIEEQIKINPSVTPPSSNLWVLTCQQDFAGIRSIANQKWTKNNGIQPSFFYYIAYLEDGYYEQAIKISESIQAKSEDQSVRLSTKGHFFARIGDRERALEILEDLAKLSESRSVSNVYSANIYYALGDKEQTLEYLERALQERDCRVRAFRDPTAFNLIDKNEPWLQDFIRRSWIPQSDDE